MFVWRWQSGRFDDTLSTCFVPKGNLTGWEWMRTVKKITSVFVYCFFARLFYGRPYSIGRARHVDKEAWWQFLVFFVTSLRASKAKKAFSRSLLNLTAPSSACSLTFKIESRCCSVRNFLIMDTHKKTSWLSWAKNNHRLDTYACFFRNKNGHVRMA